ncbi:hypothetical protein BJ742DRAFT_849286 [Cladochytrium replicatum]|nr:hypothetical protein BJ742DRAFT_849286 [Cladochytrium replicatum]
MFGQILILLAFAVFLPTALIHRSLLWIGLASIIYGVFQWGFFRYFGPRSLSRKYPIPTSKPILPTQQIDPWFHRSPTPNDPFRTPTTPLQESLHAVLIRVLSSIWDPILTPLSRSRTSQSLPDTFRSQILDPKASHLATLLAHWISEHQRTQLEQRLWVRVLAVVHRHLKQYKRFRREVLRDKDTVGTTPRRVGPVHYGSSTALFADSQKDAQGDASRHIEEFNEYSGDRWDATHRTEAAEVDLKPFESPFAQTRTTTHVPPDDLNALIASRMLDSECLHPNSPPGREREFVMKRIDGIWDALEKSHAFDAAWTTNESSFSQMSWAADSGRKGKTEGRTSRLLRILVREWIGCQVVIPLINTVCQPDFLNGKVSEIAQRRVLQRTMVQRFRGVMETQFSRFPPAFLVDGRGSSMWDHIDTLAKCAKRLRYYVDLKAIHYQVVHELRKVVDQYKTGKGLSPENLDALRRVAKSLNSLRIKYEKRIAALSSSPTDSRTPQYRVKKVPGGQIFSPPDSRGTGASSPVKVTLKETLEEYLDSGEKEIDSSSSLYYFMAFLESRGQKRDISRVRFWLAAEKYRQLEVRLAQGIISLDKDGNEDRRDDGETIGMVSRLRKEAQKIYSTYLSGQTPPIVLPDPRILDSIRAFVADPPEPSEQKSLLEAQNAVEKELNESCFHDFLRSESFFRYSSEVQKQRLANDMEVGGGEQQLLMLGTPGVGVAAAATGRGATGMNSAEEWNGAGELFDFGDEERSETRQSLLLTALLQDLKFSASRLVPKSHSDPTRLDTDGMDLDPSNPNAYDLADLARARKDLLADDEPDQPEFLATTTQLDETVEEMDKVKLQLECLNLLITQVQATTPLGNPTGTAQVFLLESTKEILKQEIGDLSRQKAKLESSSEGREVIVPGMYAVSIVNADEGDPSLGSHNSAGTHSVGHGEEGAAGVRMGRGGQGVTYYLIRLERENGTGWTVIRRYSEFHNLHRKLREKHPQVNDFELPGKSLGIWPRGKADHGRMQALEKYLQRLVDDGSLSQSEELRQFLSSAHVPMRRFARNSGRDPEGDSYREGTRRTNRFPRLIHRRQNHRKSHNPNPASDPTPQISTPAHDSTTQPPHRLRSSSASSADSITPEDVNINDTSLRSTLPDNSGSDTTSDDGEGWDDSSSEHEFDEDDMMQSNMSPLIEPLCSILMEVYEFKEQSFWLRRNAAVLLLRQWLGSRETLGGTIAAFLKKYVTEDRLNMYIGLFGERIGKATPWDNASTGRERRSFAQIFSDYGSRTSAEKVATRAEARSRIVSAIPEVFGRMLGVEAATKGTERLFDVFQSEILNRHLIYTIIDAVIHELMQE